MLQFESAEFYKQRSIYFQRPYASTAPYTLPYNWSPPAQSNDLTNGYVLERSNSARKTLERACELCPELEQEMEDPSEDCVEEADKYQPQNREAMQIERNLEYVFL